MNFENWYNKMLNEEAAAAPSQVTVDVKPSISGQVANVQSKEDIINDVDSIMAQLDQLSAQVKEDQKNIELEWGFESLSENLILEGAWDDAKSSYGSLFSDPIFQLVGLGITGVISAIGLTGFGAAKYIKDTKRNSAIAKQVLGDYERLKKQKLDELDQEAVIQKFELQKDQIGAEENESFTNIQEADPAVAKKPTVKPAKNPIAKKTPVDPESKDLQIQKMKARIDAQINTLKKKKDMMSAGIQKLEEFLDKKYKSTDNDGNSKITGFGSGKVHKLIAQAEDDVQITVDEARLKLFGGEMDPAAKKKVAERVNRLKQESAQRTAKINKEAEENAKKAKEIAAEDEETKNALADLEKGKTPEAETKEEPTSDNEDGKSDKGDEKSDAMKSIEKSQEDDSEEAKKKREERAANKEDDTKNAEKETTKNTKDGKLDRVEDMIKKETEKIQNNPEAKKIKDKITELEGAIEEIKNKEKKSKNDEDTLKSLQSGLDLENRKLDKISSSDKLDKLKGLKDQIAAKENWQLEGTELGRLFEMEISKLEKEYMINESSSLSISDKFKLLMG